MAILAHSPQRISQASLLSASFTALTLTFPEVTLLQLQQDLRLGLQALPRGWRPAGLPRNLHPVDRVDSTNPLGSASPFLSVPTRCRPASLTDGSSMRWTFCQDLQAHGRYPSWSSWT